MSLRTLAEHIRADFAATSGGHTLAAVREALAEGATSRADIARRAHISPFTVDAILAHLERTGQLRREVLASSCSSGACAQCAVGSSCPGPSSSAARGPVMLVLTHAERPRE
ncbi:FeoC-like transcriptional regulator [Corynebacterium uropygiale]|uniref:FeoC-like transcriptional regulator n=1 Tax=Corynebacterium uropygiale TaxID=1775911 RepID=A0A9X1QRB1_9CORY|nr:FeoC-like transcriptional regulator [Corynebacterium uropygiale]MCF4007706.1 FeoC-like transcriptional regulator [Corynebacterium uropygiale]